MIGFELVWGLGGRGKGETVLTESILHVCVQVVFSAQVAGRLSIHIFFLGIKLHFKAWFKMIVVITDW